MDGENMNGQAFGMDGGGGTCTGTQADVSAVSTVDLGAAEASSGNGIRVPRGRDSAVGAGDGGTVNERVERERIAGRRVQALIKSAVAAAERFPAFDLEREMRDPEFVRLAAATGGNAAAAYVARHHEELMASLAREAEERGAAAVTSAMMRNRRRPVERGVDGGSTAVERSDPSTFSLSDFRRIRENYRKTGKSEKF